MKKLVLATTATLASASAAFAAECGPFNQTDCAEVPEISALEGTAALAVVAAVVLLAWERRRRAV